MASSRAVHVHGARTANDTRLAGGVAGAATRPSSAATAIEAAAGLVPAGFALVATAIMSVHPLTESRFREMVRDIAARRVERRAAAASGAPALEG